MVSIAIVSIAGCEPGGISLPTPVPAAPAPVSVTPAQSSESAALQAHYAKAEAELLAQGLLRRDGGGPDVPFSSRDLVENFIKIGFFSEYRRDSRGRYIRSETKTVLNRWTSPVHFALYFGEQTPTAKRTQLGAELRRYTRQLNRATGHPIAVNSDTPNFHIMVVDEDERQALRPTLTTLDPRLTSTDMDAIMNLPRQTFCRLVTVSSRVTPHVYDVAFAIIRSEHPARLTTQCLHEELAQGLGLPNDSRYARPSIFNDNEEFGLLTPHDEMLLKMLYDPRLQPGMDAEAARPIIEVMSRELIPDEV